jgi:hypothetical protein
LSEPDPQDPTSSLRRQLRGKMKLLSKRLDRPLKYDLFQGGLSSEKMWASLYDYRSHLVHGGKPDWKSRFHHLSSSNAVQEFLYDAVKVLFRFALREPELVQDLQKL